MKMRAGFILLALLLAVLPLADAFAAEGDAFIADADRIREEYDDRIQGACVLGDTLYLCGKDHLFSYRVGDQDVTPVEYALPRAGEDESVELQCMFSDGEKLCLLVSTTRFEEDDQSVDRLELFPVELDGETAALGEGTEAEYAELARGEDDSFMQQPIDACCVDGFLMLLVYDDDYMPDIYQLDMASGEGKFIERADGGEYVGITPYEDGQLLIQTFDEAAKTSAFYAYAPGDERLTAVCEPIQLDENSYGLRNMAYSRESGKLYYRADGCVMAMEGFDYANAQQVAVLSANNVPESAGLLLPGDHYVLCGDDNVIVRGTDPSQMAEARLVVQSVSGGDLIMDTYYSFSNSHSDVDVVLTNDYPSADELLEAMMKRDDSVDIYMTQVDSQGFDALYRRGYMLELDDPALTRAVEGMYPFARDVLTRDGAVVAVPVYLRGWTVSLDVEGFEKIGIPGDEVPTSWKELLELLPSLADKLPDDGSLYVFDENNDQRAIRYMLYTSLLDAWRTRQDALGEVQSYDDPALCEMMTAIRDLDLGALGVPEPEDDDMEEVGFMTDDVYGQPHRLVQFLQDFTIGEMMGDSKPAPLSVLPGEQPWLPLNMTVAFINPFTKNYELAQAFLAELEENLDDATRYDLSDALNEPVPDPKALKALEEERQELERRRALLEGAQEIDKPAIEDDIRSLEDRIAEMEREAYIVSARDIEWYRSLAPYITVERFDYLNLDDEDDNLETEELRKQLLAGKIDPANFLKELDRKARMRAMEGN